MSHLRLYLSSGIILLAELNTRSHSALIPGIAKRSNAMVVSKG
jgi:hypothetical protein